jgi:hypothetical protein
VKSIKMFGLAALTALMAMAFVGASSAMAEPTALCKADESLCSAANTISHVHEESVGKAKLLTSFGTTECNVLFLGDTEEATGEGATFTVTGTFTYTNCVLGGSSCTATEENSPAEIQVLKEGHETAKVTGEGLVHLVCGKSIDCSYNGVGLVGTARGPLLSAQTPDNGEVTISEATTNKETGGFLCPKTSKLDITTTPLVATSLTAATTHYCVKLTRPVGFYKKVTSGVCEEKQKEPKSEYELVYGRPGLTAGTVVCVLLSTARGLWNDRGCSSNNAGNTGRYEKGTIQ